MSALARTAEERIEEMELAIYGSDKNKVPGILNDMAEVKKAVKEWHDMKLTLRGIWIGLGLTGIVSVANLLTLLSQIAGVKP